MDNNYTISRMNAEEVKLAIKWAEKVGWNPGLHDSECFYQTDPQGFFAGRLNGKIIAMGSAVIYDDDFGFCGLYIVDDAYRGQGYGLALTQARLAYIGQRNAGIDGVLNMLNRYERLGYRFAHQNARYQGTKFPTSTKSQHTLLPLSTIDFSQLAQYDRNHFPASRPTFLKCWINQPGATALGCVQQEKLCGYGVIRPCYQGFKIGPLFAKTPAIAEELFLNLVKEANGQLIYLDIPENNPHAIALVKRHQLEKVFATERMYLKGQPTLASEEIYGITSFELG